MAYLTEGEFFVARKLLGERLGHDPYAFTFFIHAIGWANTGPTTGMIDGKKVKLPAGYMPMGWRSMAKALGWGSPNTVKRAARAVEKAFGNDFQLRSFGSGSVLKLANYLKYQQPKKRPPVSRNDTPPARTPRRRTARVSPNDPTLRSSSRTKIQREREKREAARRPAPELLRLYNEHRAAEFFPARDVASLSRDCLEGLVAAWTKEPNELVWQIRLNRMAASTWVSGRTPGKDGKFFTTRTALEFLASNRERIDAGVYDPRPGAVGVQTGPAVPAPSPSQMTQGNIITPTRHGASLSDTGVVSGEGEGVPAGESAAPGLVSVEKPDPSTWLTPTATPELIALVRAGAMRPATWSTGGVR